MKFSKMLDEEVSENHQSYKKQKTNQLTADQIFTMRQQLSKKSVDNKTIFGYITDNNVKCKYNKESMIFVRYNDEKIIETKMITWGNFSGNKSCEYLDELT